ncbi:MAG: STAS domain-containing protein, partial [Actinobacteria bacterium]|nr:STAS domain-containing protein [Actinomycetota bacterium]
MIVDQCDTAVLVVWVVGEIDLLTESPLHDHLRRLLAARPERLIIDLTHTSFLGATALSVLIDARRTAAQQGTTLQLRAPNGLVMGHTLEIAGLDCLFEILPPATDTHRSPRSPAAEHPDVPRPRETDHNDTGVATSPQSSADTPQ